MRKEDIKCSFCGKGITDSDYKYVVNRLNEIGSECTEEVKNIVLHVGCSCCGNILIFAKVNKVNEKVNINIVKVQ